MTDAPQTAEPRTDSPRRSPALPWLDWSRTSHRIGAIAAAVLLANSAYLAVDGNPHPIYFGNLLLHLVLAPLVTLALAIWWWRRRQDRWLFVGGGLILASALAGAALLAVGNVFATRWLAWTHGGLAAAGLLVLLGWALTHLSGTRRRLVTAALALALAVPILGFVWRQVTPEPNSTITNPPAPTNMAEEAMGGEDGPFFPSSVSNTHGGYVDSSIYLGPENCARAGCHKDVFDQWESSAHHLSSFNNQWYRKSIEYMQETTGIVPSKWCGGCHDPAVLQTGRMDDPIIDQIHTPESQAGITCTACHMISSVESTMGQGDYEITVPALHDLAASDNPVLLGIHDLIVRANPEPHRKTFLKPFFENEFSPEYCSACHKVHLDVPVNNYRWIRGFNSYDNWQASGVSGYGARSFYYPAQSQTCIDCHMPQVESDDPGNKHGLIRSHRFAAANTALPTAYGDEEQLQAVVDFLQNRQVTVDIFAMTEGRDVDEQENTGLALEGPALATTFAVGEESGMAVGTGGAATGPAEPIYAPLDRIPATVRRGESTRIDVVVRTRGVGHFFPGGTVDAFDVWLELKAEDEDGQILYWSGMADEYSPVEKGAHFYRSRMIDAEGNPIDKRNAFHSRAVVYVNLIPPGAADTVRFRLQVPEDAGDRIELTAKLNYRKFNWFNNHWAYAGEPAEGDTGTFGKDHDNRRFSFTADMSDVSGPTKEVPVLPIVVMAEDTQSLRVVDADAQLPDLDSAAERPAEDRERWNDYGIGLFRAGDLRGAKAAFTRVTELEPEYVDGWVNLARVALAEGDLPEAQRVLDEALALEPELARAHFFSGLTDKETGNYEEALEHLAKVVQQYPRDRVVRNQAARVYFLLRDYENAVAQLEEVFSIDPEDLMGHYTAMLSYRGLGDIERSEHHQTLYERFKADESAPELTQEYRQRHPEDNNERQPIHEHTSPTREQIEHFLESFEERRLRHGTDLAPREATERIEPILTATAAGG